jgi:shikimate dehydrogenase
MKLDGKTRVVGVIGWPVEHSLSPPMQNAALEALGLNWIYVPFPVAPAAVEQALAGVRALQLVGINCTIPHKAAILAHLDEVSEEVRFLGVGNTIVNREGHLSGYNTDVDGFLRAVHETGWTLRDQSVVVLGAGGSARAISYAAVQDGAARVTVLNRTLSRARELVDHLAPVAGDCPLQAVALAAPEANLAITSAQVLVDCTAVGMYPHHEVSPIVPGALLHEGQLVCDLTYNPRRTVLLQAAEQAGAQTLDGTGMLVHQGALALELWTGREAPVEVMRQALLRALEERSVAPD